LTPYYLSLVHDAAAKSFWRRKTLIKFLDFCGVSDEAIATWTPRETKRAFLARVVWDLPRLEGGLAVLDRIAGLLTDQRSFPDLRRGGDTSSLVSDAQEAVSRLALYRNGKDEHRAPEEYPGARDAFRREQSEVLRHQEMLRSFAARLGGLVHELDGDVDDRASLIWLHDLFDFSGIKNLRPAEWEGGSQLDSVATFSGTDFLVRRRFGMPPVQAKDIGELFDKVLVAQHYCMALYVSIPGYTSCARREASGEGTPILLCDHSHLCVVLSGAMGMGEAIAKLLLHRARTGAAYLPAEDLVNMVNAPSLRHGEIS